MKFTTSDKFTPLQNQPPHLPSIDASLLMSLPAKHRPRSVHQRLVVLRGNGDINLYTRRERRSVGSAHLPDRYQEDISILG
ncbi:MAG: hypothetical protein ACLPWG_22770 [Steroidobacteraceae bacterium]